MYSPDRIYVICALAAEARTVLHSGCHISVCGIGRRCADAAVRAALARRPAAVVSWGVAGGLEPGLASGALVVPAHVGDQHGRTWPTGARGGVGSLITAESPVSSLADKRRFRQLGFDSVDMESAVIAARCHGQGVPFLCVRAIADDADSALPPWLIELVGADGKPRLGAAMRRACSGFSQARTLVQGALMQHRALGSLRGAALRIPQWLGVAA